MKSKGISRGTQESNLEENNTIVGTPVTAKPSRIAAPVRPVPARIRHKPATVGVTDERTEVEVRVAVFHLSRNLVRVFNHKFPIFKAWELVGIFVSLNQIISHFT
ncbi:MAG: hypothetical protein COX02_00065 [Candidatus Vogelbacteria bacterium CG22_combo_CG10-13_8_21_14_all_37_9]|uniref:Uncharacterized protein n=1 Tax=Candidatus Vogelbacteria bacterium CG22_combo_CG10-13_8_21_14_all_37_9 TaxID=1975046 RepID=A0A2H0BLD2_9BACT|nr:MAG: hypothetical protein COX02_00065 [Candidatus Vogelbacteria bacterium CG22_combo_CG10-13_8_21_14_all_37_9]